jgi:predicted DNA-binding helix-hairpin-helix protein
MSILTQLAELKPLLDVEDPEDQQPSLPFSAVPLTSIPHSLSGTDCKKGNPESIPGCPAGMPVYQTAVSGGQRIPLLKTLLTSACERDCNYCGCRSGRDFRRQTFKPEEMAKITVNLYQAGLIKGIFLSSGVAGGSVRTQDQLIAAAEIMRKRLGYRGYLHLKIMPGAEEAQIRRAMELADRVSVNLEAPTKECLDRLAPQKILLDELLAPLRKVESIRRYQPAIQGWNGHWPSSTTQFVVGAVGETDLDLMRASEYLMGKVHLTRVYFSRFSPVSGTPLENHPPENPWRTHRLYQASFLLRDYGYQYEDLPFTSSGLLPLEDDPKRIWARLHLSQTPLELNKADLGELLRVPGIGPRRARMLIHERRKNRLTTLEDLKRLGIPIERAAPFVLLAGYRPIFQQRLI